MQVNSSDEMFGQGTSGSLVSLHNLSQIYDVLRLLRSFVKRARQVVLRSVFSGMHLRLQHQVEVRNPFYQQGYLQHPVQIILHLLC